MTNCSDQLFKGKGEKKPRYFLCFVFLWAAGKNINLPNITPLQQVSCQDHDEWRSECKFPAERMWHITESKAGPALAEKLCQNRMMLPPKKFKMRARVKSHPWVTTLAAQYNQQVVQVSQTFPLASERFPVLWRGAADFLSCKRRTHPSHTQNPGELRPHTTVTGGICG